MLVDGVGDMPLYVTIVYIDLDNKLKLLEVKKIHVHPLADRILIKTFWLYKWLWKLTDWIKLKTAAVFSYLNLYTLM